jgi:hypothetical protein
MTPRPQADAIRTGAAGAARQRVRTASAGPEEPEEARHGAPIAGEHDVPCSHRVVEVTPGASREEGP